VFVLPKEHDLYMYNMLKITASQWFLNRFLHILPLTIFHFYAFFNKNILYFFWVKVKLVA